MHYKTAPARTLCLRGENRRGNRRRYRSQQARDNRANVEMFSCKYRDLYFAEVARETQKQANNHIDNFRAKYISRD